MSDDWTPADQFIIRDMETLKTLSHPLRVALLRALRAPGTVKAIAQTLDKPPTKLYYHVNLLETHGLITVVDTKVVSGIPEKTYQVTAHRYRVDNALIFGEDAAGRDLFLSDLLDGTRREIQQAMDAGLLRFDPEEDETHILTRVMMPLTPVQFADYRRRLRALQKEMMALSLDQQSADARPYGLTVAFYPMAQKQFDAEEPDDGE